MVPTAGRQGVDPCRVHELLRFRRRREPPAEVGRRIVNLGAAADVADLAFDENLRSNALQCLDRCPRLTDIFLQRQRGDVEHDPVEARSSGFDRAGQRMGVIGVQEHREVVFLTQAPDHSGDLSNTEELSFPFGDSYDDRNALLTRAFEGRLHRD